MKSIFICLSAMTLLIFASCRKEVESPKIQVNPNVVSLSPGVHSLEVSALSSSTQYDCIVNNYYLYVNTNLGGNTSIRGQAWTYSGTPVVTRGFFGFTGISFLPAGTTVTNATLTLTGLPGADAAEPTGNSYYPGSPYNSYGTNPCYIKRVTSAWDPTTLTWNTQPTFTATNQATVPASTSQWNYNATIDVTALVQDIVNSGTNYGFVLQQQTETYYRNLAFASSYFEDATRRPKLSITYSIP